MMFASKMPRRPKAYLCEWHDSSVRHNEPNSILVNLRQRIAAGLDIEDFAQWLEQEYNQRHRFLGVG